MSIDRPGIDPAELPPDRPGRLPENIDLCFLFAPHGSPADIGDLRERLRSIDIYIPEAIHWQEETLKNLQKIAKGDYKTLQRQRQKDRTIGLPYPEHREAQHLALYGSGVAVDFVDVKGKAMIIGKTQQQQVKERLSKLFVSSLEQTLANVDGFFTEEAEAANSREDEMLRNLSSRIPALIERTPRLRQKERVRVLMSLGAGHIRIYHEAHAANQDGGATVSFVLSDKSD